MMLNLTASSVDDRSKYKCTSFSAVREMFVSYFKGSFALLLLHWLLSFTHIYDICLRY